MICDFPKDLYIPDGKNSKMSQIINKWVFDRQTPDGNEGVGIEIPYLECAYGTRYYVIDTVNGNINAIHDNNTKPTDFFGCFSPFDLRELEFNVCRVTDHHNSEDNPGWMKRGAGAPGGGSSPTTVSQTEATETIP